METLSRRVAAVLTATVAFSLCPVPAHAGDPGCSHEEPFTPFDTIDGDNPVVMQTGRVVELRASNKSKCAWGRLSSGTPGEEIWTDRKSHDGSAYEGFLGYTRIDSGDAKYTEPFNNDNKLMRACGSSHSVIECTGWF